MPADYRLISLQRSRADGTTYRHWQIKWTDADGPHRLSLGTDNRATAEATAHRFWIKRTVAGSDTMSVLMEGYLHATTGARANKRDRESWAAAKSFWGDVRPADVNAQLCLDYAAKRQRAANTIRNEIATLRAALKWAKITPSEKLWMPPSPESTVEHVTKAEFRQLLEGARAPHVKLFMQLAIATGARSSALRALKWERVDLKRNQIDLNPTGATQVSNKRKAVVPINEQLHPVLVEAKAGAMSEFVIEYKGGPIAKIQNGFVAASTRSGIHCTPHMLRHSAAVWMAEERTPMEEIAAYLGHKNTAITTAVYARFNPDYLQRAAKALTW
jgi:integrase